MPEVRGQRVGEPGVDVVRHVATGSPGEFVAYGFVPVAGLGLLQRAHLAQRLELIGAGRDPCGLAVLGFPGGGRGFGGELGLDDVVGVRAVDGARRRVGEQLRDALPLREFRGRGRRRPGPRAWSPAVRRTGRPRGPRRRRRRPSSSPAAVRRGGRCGPGRRAPGARRRAGRADGAQYAGAARAWSSSASYSWRGFEAGRRQSAVRRPVGLFYSRP